MSYERKDGDGILFRVKEVKSEKHPTMTGNLLLGGVEYDIAAWTKTSQKTGDKFLTLRVEPASDGRVERGGTKREERPGSIRDMDSDLPF